MQDLFKKRFVEATQTRVHSRVCFFPDQLFNFSGRFL